MKTPSEGAMGAIVYLLRPLPASSKHANVESSKTIVFTSAFLVFEFEFEDVEDEVCDFHVANPRPKAAPTSPKTILRQMAMDILK